MSEYKFSSQILNYIEPYKIGGVTKTKFFTEHDTNYSVGDVLYIIGGNYDVAENDSDGYEILLVDNDNLWVVLDIDYTSILPYNEKNIDQLTNVFLVDSLEKLNYEKADNSFQYYEEDGKKYSMENNSLFISKLTSLSNTTESNVYNRFFKTFDNPIITDQYNDTYGYLLSSTNSYVNLLSVPTNISVYDVMGETTNPFDDTYNVSIAAFNSHTGIKSDFSTPVSITLSAIDSYLMAIEFDYVSGANSYVIKLVSSTKTLYTIETTNSIIYASEPTNKSLGNSATYSISYNNMTSLEFGSNYNNENKMLYAVGKGSTNSHLWMHNYINSPVGSFKQTISGTYYQISTISNTSISPLVGLPTYTSGIPKGFYRIVSNTYPSYYYGVPFLNMNYINGGFNYLLDLGSPYLPIYAADYNVFSNNGYNYLAQGASYYGSTVVSFFYSTGITKEFVNNIQMYFDDAINTSTYTIPITMRIYGYKYLTSANGQFTSDSDVNFSKLPNNVSAPTLLYQGVPTANNTLSLNLNNADYYNIYEINIEYSGSLVGYTLRIKNLVLSTNISKTLNSQTGFSFSQVSNFSLVNNNDIVVPLDGKALYFLPRIANGATSPTFSNVSKYYKLNYNATSIQSDSSLGITSDIPLKGDYIPYTTITNSLKSYNSSNFNTLLMHNQYGVYALANDSTSTKTIYGLNINYDKLTTLGIGTWSTVYDSEFVEKVSIPSGYLDTYPTDNLYGTFFTESLKKWDKYIVTTDNGIYNLYLNFYPDTSTIKLKDKHRIYNHLVEYSNPTIPYNTNIYRNISKFEYKNKNYIIGCNVGGNTYSSIVNLGTNSNIPFTYNTYGDNISSVVYAPVKKSFYVTINGVGIDVFNTNTNALSRIDMSSTVDNGNMLPSTTLYKTYVTSNGYTDFVYTATDKGIYRLVYNTSKLYNYYYAIDFDNGYTNLNSNINRNDKVLIPESFEYNGTYFKKNKVYKYDPINREWVLDISYEKPYISNTLVNKANILDVSWNNGIYGDYKNVNVLKATYSIFNNGVFINSKISNITFNSSSDLLGVYNYSKIKNNVVSKTTDKLNNGGFGYNEFNDVQIVSGTISNGIVSNGYVGYTTSNNVFFNTIHNISLTFSNVNILKGKVIDSYINSITVSNVTTINTTHYNTSIHGSNIISGESMNSYLYKNYINNKGEIKIVDYDIWTNLINDDSDDSVIGFLYTYKFYINEEDLNKIGYGDKLKLSIINSSVKLNYLNNNNLYVSSGTSSNGFYTDVYEDIYTLNKYNHNILVSKRKSNQNNIKTVANENLDGVTLINNDKNYASIDITLLRYFNKASNNLTSILKDKNYYFKIYNIDNSFICINDFDSTYIKDNTIEYLSDINNKGLILNTIGNSLDMKLYNTYSIKATFSNVSNIKPFKVNDILYLDTINFNSNNQSIKVENFFTVNTYSGSYVILGATLPSNNIFATATYFNGNTTFSTTIAKNVYAKKNILSYNTILDGIFSGSEIQNNTFNANSNTLILFNNVQQIDTNTYSGNTLHVRSYLENSNLNGIKMENSIIYNSIVLNSSVEKTAIINSTFSGYINKSNIDTKIPSVGDVNYASLLINSNIIGGTISNSDILLSNVTDTYLLKDLIVNTNVNTSKIDKTNMVSGIIYSGNFNSGVIGYNTNYMNLFNIDKYKKYSKSYLTFSAATFSNGNFNGGLMVNNYYNGYTYNDATDEMTLTSVTYSSYNTWINGTFNNGQIKGGVSWLNGTFNNGDFQSDYGDGIITFSWKNGKFNGGKFGDKLNVNTTWGDGTFNGGLFIGKIWNNGTFIKGEFQGSGIETYTYSNTDIVHGALNPYTFMYNYNNSDSYYGLWRDGKVSYNMNDITDTEVLTNRNNIELLLKDKYKIDNKNTVSFKNMLWVRGTFDNGLFENSVFLSGVFNNGNFKYSSFNPWTERKQYNIATSSSVWSFDLSTYSVWNNGTLNMSVFNISDFNNGTIIGGKNPITGANDQRYSVLLSAYVKNALSYYTNAYNTIWLDGKWKNGNWYGTELASSIVDIPALQYLTTNDVYNPSTYSQNGLYKNMLVKNYERYNTLNNVDIKTYSNHVMNSMIVNTTIDPFVGYGSYNWTSNMSVVSPTYATINDLSYRYNNTIGLYEALGKVGVTSTFTQSVNTSNYGTLLYNRHLTEYTTFNTEQLLILSSSGQDDLLVYYPNLSNILTDTSTIVLQPTADISISDGDTIEFRLDPITIPKYTNITFEYESSTNSYSDMNLSLGSGGASVSFNNQKGYMTFDKAVQMPRIRITTTNYLSSVTSSGYFSDVYSSATFSLSYNLYKTNTVATYSIYNNTYSGTVSWTKNVTNDNSLSYYAFSSYSYSVSEISVQTDVNTLYTNELGKKGVVRTKIGNGSFLSGIWENGSFISGLRLFDNWNTKSHTMLGDQVISSYRIDNKKFNIKIGIPVINNYNVNNTQLDIIEFFREDNSSIVDGKTKIAYSKIVNISNLICIDINNHKTPLNGLLTATLDLVSGYKRYVQPSDLLVSDIRGTKYYTLNIIYDEKFPIIDIRKDSNRHLIYITKNIFLNGNIYNTVYEGVINNAVISGMPDNLILKNTHIIDGIFKSGKFVGTQKNYAGSYSKVSNINTLDENGSYTSDGINVQSIIDDYSAYYPNNKFNTSLVQNFTYYDGLVLNNGLLPLASPTAGTYDFKYVYTSVLDLVHDDFEMSTVVDDTLANWKLLYRTIVSTTQSEYQNNNIPSGQKIVDILRSTSNISYEKGINLSTTQSNVIAAGSINSYQLKLGTNYEHKNLLFSADFEQAPYDNMLAPSLFSTYSVGSYSIGIYGATSFNLIKYTGSYTNVIADNGLIVVTSSGYIDGEHTALLHGNNHYYIGGYANNIFKNRYTMVEVDMFNDIDFPEGQQNYTSPTSSSMQISNSYNIYGSGSFTGFINSTYSEFLVQNDMLYTNSQKLVKRNTYRTYLFNNSGGYKNEIFISNRNTTRSQFYSIKLYEVDRIPQFIMHTYSNTIGTVWINQNGSRSVYNNVVANNGDISGFDDLNTATDIIIE